MCYIQVHNEPIQTDTYTDIGSRNYLNQRYICIYFANLKKKSLTISVKRVVVYKYFLLIVLQEY